METRNTKYRAWDGKKMIYANHSETFSIDANGGAKELFYDPKHPNSLQVKRLDWVLMESIGLKDITGKDIFEHDVVEYWLCNHEAGEHDLDCPFNAYQIVYCDDMAAFTYKDGDARYFINSNHKHRVIGNIYQNPALADV